MHYHYLSLSLGLLAVTYFPFLLVRDEFYRDPDAVRAHALAMDYFEPEDASGFRTRRVYHEPGIRKRLERILGTPITRWDDDPDEGNGVFYLSFSRGKRKDLPGVHSDDPPDDITILVYLTPGLPERCGTSLWRHRPTGLVSAPSRADAKRLSTTRTKLYERIDRDSRRADRWVEVDRAGYKYNRMVAYASGMLHSASQHFGRGMADGRIYQTFRVGVDWSRCGIGR